MAIDKEWLPYLPKDGCTVAVFCGTDPNNFKRLADLAVKFHDELADEDLRESWRGWLIDNAGGDSWEMRAVQGKRIEFEQVAWERANKPKVSEKATLILADPPWQYDFAETDSRQIENKYPSATVEEICSHISAPWAPPLAEDCALFLWATAPKLREALEVMKEWGFEYKTHAVWDKEKIGMGYWFRGQHELLLVGTRGGASPPEADKRVSSVFREVRSGHSKKPECVYQAIEAAFPTHIQQGTAYEFYQRKARKGWKGVGNEAESGE